MTNELTDLVEAIRGALPDIELDTAAQSKLEDDCAAIEGQIHSPNPKTSIIREGLSSARRILEGAAGNVLASGLVAQIAPVIAALS